MASKWLLVAPVAVALGREGADASGSIMCSLHQRRETRSEAGHEPADHA